MITWFKNIDKNDLPLVGGKGANLGEMTRHGLPVPPGFCVTVKAYEEHLARIALSENLKVLKMAEEGDDREKAAEVSIEIQGKIMNTPMDGELENAVIQAYKELQIQEGPAVSVRSSATAEDLPTASFAGQQETFLSVIGEDQLLIHIKKCWASLWTPRAVAYRQTNGFSHSQVALSVVVQAMVQSEKAGVLFTMNPISGQTDQMMINASYGLGESIVAGLVTPDTFILSKKGKNSLIRQELGTKQIRIVSAFEGLTKEVEVKEEDKNRYCLNNVEIEMLRELGIRVENHYGYPQDIEWAFKGHCLYLLQTRPVTTIQKKSNKRKTSNKSRMNKVEQKILDNLKEHIPNAPYPLDFEPLVQLTEMKNRAFRELGIRMPKGEKMFLMGSHGDMKTGKILPFIGLKLFLLPWTVNKMVKGRGEEQARNLEISNIQSYMCLKDKDLELLTTLELGVYLEQTIELAMNWSYLRFSAYVFPMMILGKLLNRLIKKSSIGEGVNQYDLLGDLDYMTCKIERDIYKLALEIEKDKKTKEFFIEGDMDLLIQKFYGDEFLPKVGGMFKEFLERYGSRMSMAYLPFSSESWNENPRLLMGTMSVILKEGNILMQLEKDKKGKRSFNRLKTQILGKLPPLKKKRYTNLLNRFRQAHKGREELGYRMEQAYYLARRGRDRAVKILLKENLIQKPDDILMFTLTELVDILKGHGKATDILVQLEKRREHRKEVEEAWSHISYGDTEGNILKGLSGSPGFVEGRVKVIHGPEEFGNLEKGDVLVCRFTDPVWTPLFTVASAVVCDTGGPLSHAAIVAREYGIPAVLGVGSGTSCLKDGDLVVVQGTEGVVRIC